MAVRIFTAGNHGVFGHKHIKQLLLGRLSAAVMRHLQHIDVSVKIVVEQTVVDVFYEIVLSLLVAVPGSKILRPLNSKSIMGDTLFFCFAELMVLYISTDGL